jgi:hypothetical protein
VCRDDPGIPGTVPSFKECVHFIFYAIMKKNSAELKKQRRRKSVRDSTG